MHLYEIVQDDMHADKEIGIAVWEGGKVITAWSSVEIIKLWRGRVIFDGSDDAIHIAKIVSITKYADDSNLIIDCTNLVSYRV